MGTGILLGALALGTIGSGLVALIWHFSSMMRDPQHRLHAHNIFVRNGKAAATRTAEAADVGSQLAKPLITRLNESIDSQHEADPSLGSSQAKRQKTFNRERSDSSANVQPAASA